MPLLGPDLTPERYAEVLQCLLLVLRSWEQWSGEHAPERLRSLLAPRQRSGLLSGISKCLASPQGRRTVATPFAGRPPCWSLARPKAAALRGSSKPGSWARCMWLEGSTLGGRFLARQVESALQLTPGEGNAYFEGHGADTGKLWREVTAEVAAVPEELSGRVVRAAKRTFAVFAKALDHGQPALLTLQTPRPWMQRTQREIKASKRK